MGIASIARTEQVEVATTCRKFATSDLGITNCDEIRMCLLSGQTLAITDVAVKKLTIRKRPIRDFGASHCSSVWPISNRISLVAVRPC